VRRSRGREHTSLVKKVVASVTAAKPIISVPKKKVCDPHNFHSTYINHSAVDVYVDVYVWRAVQYGFYL
jgi:hypothetical protein